HLVTLQKITQGEIGRLVLGSLPGPDAVALDDDCHGEQFVGVIYSGNGDEASFWVNLTDEVDSGLGKHGVSWKGL
ncbi:hypothetical protein GOODEAATRI_009441, partial [Goodea atripinnis]